MLMQGQFIQVEEIEGGIYDVIFDRKDEDINKFDQAALEELRDAVSHLNKVSGLKGVLFSSRKELFIAGADITEFIQMFSSSEEDIYQHIHKHHEIFNGIEDLSCPTVVAINGTAVGGGFELCLAVDYRVMSTTARVGLPEVKLGINPGWGGTVRLPRLLVLIMPMNGFAAARRKKQKTLLKKGQSMQSSNQTNLERVL